MHKRTLIKPPALRKGDTIGIMAPSSRVDKKIVEEAVKGLEAMGFRVYVHPQTFAYKEQSAGTVEQKIKALHDLYRNPEIKAIITAKGGNQAAKLLKLLDYKLISRHPKILMGYSDTTILLNAIQAKTGVVTFHGPMVGRLGRDLPPAQRRQCLDLLTGKTADINMPRAKVLKAGSISGRLVGGNLSLIVNLLGTPFQPDFRNAILFIEDAFDELSRYDRMLAHLGNAGALDQISGLIAGSFTHSGDNGVLPFGRTVAEIIRSHTDRLDIPAVIDAPFGHGKDLYTLPVGAKARLTAQRGKCALRLDGPAVSR